MSDCERRFHEVVARHVRATGRGGPEIALTGD
jgi:hypothetical protein